MLILPLLSNSRCSPKICRTGCFCSLLYFKVPCSFRIPTRNHYTSLLWKIGHLDTETQYRNILHTISNPLLSILEMLSRCYTFSSITNVFFNTRFVTLLYHAELFTIWLLELGYVDHQYKSSMSTIMNSVIYMEFTSSPWELVCPR